MAVLDRNSKCRANASSDQMAHDRPVCEQVRRSRQDMFSPVRRKVHSCLPFVFISLRVFPL